MSESFSNLLDESLSTLDMQPGSIVSGVVLDVDKDWVTVHVGLKSEGVISLDEFRNNEGTVDIEVGDEIEVALEAVEDGYGETRISREKARKISTWKMLEEALETQATSILLDNFSPTNLENIVKYIRSHKNGANIYIELSGGINSENIHHFCIKGINGISIGALTHNIKSKDISLDLK